MQSGKLLAMVLLVVLMQATTQAQAQCAGFTDVPPGGFCNNVVWIKNRQITLGCGDGTTYCPSEPVTRLQMALFMYRVGNTLTPSVTTIQDAGNSLAIDTGAHFHVCESALIPAVPYARTMVGQVTMTYTIAAPQIVSVAIAASVNGGGYPLPAATFSGTGAGQQQHHFVNRLFAMPADQTYRFAVFVARLGSAAVPIGDWRCTLQLHVVNAAG
jgi:hypothetical protein